MTTTYPWRAFYYVSCIDGARKALAAGPYTTHAEALAALPTVKARLLAEDPRSWWYAWGTAGSDIEMRTYLGPIPVDTVHIDTVG